MPTVSAFYGLLIRMYFADHAPPHFHARYGDDEALIDIASMSVLRGRLPRRALAMALEWGALHRTELIENWQLCERREPPRAIAPLD